jgi:hypothetical protein
MNLGGTGIASAVIGNKRKHRPDDISTTGNEITMQSATDIRSSTDPPSWIDVAIAPLIVEESAVRLGLPKVKSTILNQVSKDGINVVMECHNPSGTEGKKANVIVVLSCLKALIPALSSHQ